MKTLPISLCLLSLTFFVGPFSVAATKPNVILITVDDLNDWIGPLGGHPQIQTPEIDKLCSEGSVVFRNAVPVGSVCGPSRSGFLSGYMSSTTGIYSNGTNMLDSELVQKNPTLPEYFKKHGYYTLSTGKVFHRHFTEKGEDKGQWAFDNYFESSNSNRPIASALTSTKGNLVNGKKVQRPAKVKGVKGLSWGPSEQSFEGSKDYEKVDWAAKQLNGKMKEPFFMAVGIYKPHFPWIVAQEFFDLYDLETLQTPFVDTNDLDDILSPNGKELFKSTGDYEWVTAYGLEKEATRGYMASVSQADACLGVIMDSLKGSQYADNTIIVIIGDHGWHLGEKLRYHKNTLWIEAVRTPLIVKLPGMDSLQYCDNPVNLVDIYPTLIELCGLDEKPDLDGTSFRPFLENPEVAVDSVAVTVNGGGVSVLSKRWHYIENISGMAEEHAITARQLYDLERDPYELENLIDSKDDTHRAVIAKLSQHVPKNFHPSVRVNRKKSKGFKSLDTTIKAKRQSVLN